MKKLLLICDDLKLRKDLSEILNLANYSVAVAENGKLGMEHALADRPDLIICSVAMKGPDCYRMLKSINQDQELSLIPFIFLGNCNLSDDVRNAMDAGADDYLNYPVDATELLRSIEVRLAKSEHRQIEYARVHNINMLMNNSGKVSMTDLVKQQRDKRYFKKKDTLYEAGDRQGYLYYICSGKVKIYRTNEDGKELIVDIHSEGDFIGCHSLLDHGTSTDNALAITEVEVMLIPNKECLEVINSDSRLSKEFISLLNTELAQRDEKLLHIAYDSARRRVASGLLLVYDKFKKNGEEKPEIELGRRDLAAITGISKETVIRTLSDFKEEGLIDIAEQKIIILQHEKLRALPN